MVRCSSRSVSSSGSAAVHEQVAGPLVDHAAPQPLQEPVDAGDVVGLPGPVGVQRAHRHLVQPQRVRAVPGVHVVRAHAVLQALAHLPRPAGHRLAAVGVARRPAADDLVGWHVHAARVGERVGGDVALVDQPPERLPGRHVTQVEQHLVPEPGVQQVQHRVLHAADVQVDAARRPARRPRRHHPVPLVARVDERLVVVRVEVAQVVPARAGPLRHRVQLAPVDLAAVTQVELDVAPSPPARASGGTGSALSRSPCATRPRSRSSPAA